RSTANADGPQIIRVIYGYKQGRSSLRRRLFCILSISLSGSPETATTSANLPGLSEPSFLSQPNNLAAFSVPRIDRVHVAHPTPLHHQYKLMRVRSMGTTPASVPNAIEILLATARLIP